MMSREEYNKASLRFASAAAAFRFLLAASYLRRELRYNPNWHLQLRVPAGVPGEGGRWTDGIYGALSAVLPVLQRLGPQAIGKLREVARRLFPFLRRLPKPWSVDRKPSEDDFDEQTRRISPNSWHRFGEPNIRFRNEEELRRILGPAGKGREWHHIVEKRLAGREGFPAEVIHSTDNIISLPIEVHRRVSAKMSSSHRDFGGKVRRFWLEKMDFANQYNHGLRLIEEALMELGYDPSDF